MMYALSLRFCRFALGLLVVCWMSTGSALELVPERAVHSQHAEHGGEKHHLSLFLGNTHLIVPGAGNENAFTVGVDYEYRLSRLIGAGAVVEYASNSIDATSALAALDVHIFRGLVMQIGLGAEFIESETNELGRLGVLYEFEIGRLTVSPQFHYDITSDEDSLVFGIALGRAF